jgi:hypothetical protein
MPITDEEPTEVEEPVIEEADEDATPGDLSGGPTDVPGGGIDDDSGFVEEVEAGDDEVAGSSEGGVALWSRLTIVQRVRTAEENEVGTAERPGNDVKYNTAYYGHQVHDGTPPGVSYAWCVVFQWWCFQKSGIPTSVFPKANNVFAVRDWFKHKSRFYHAPMVGDLVIFAKSHIGFVEKLLAGNQIQTIEGNSGDAVRRHTYKADDSGIQGYCRPEYQTVTVSPPPTDKKTEAIVRALPRLQTGDQGASVKILQALLRANGQKLPQSQRQDGSFDGQFGNDTEAALKAVTGSTVADDAQWAKLLGV